MFVVSLARHGIYGHRDGADFRRSEKRRDKLRRVRQDNQDTLAATEFFPRERRRNAVHQLRELSIANDLRLA
jgi:hypothetical protein